MPQVRTDFSPADLKLRELIVYLASLEKGDEYWGAIKLNKLLFYADFMAYLRFGKSITDQEYQALKLGPAPRRLVPVIEQMMAAEDIVERPVKFHGKRQIRIEACRTADKGLFDQEQINLVHETVSRFWEMSASEISNRSHMFLGWKVCRIGETIPYHMVLIGARKATAAERRLGQRLQKLAGEALKRRGQ